MLAAVIKSEPDWDALPTETPAVLGSFLRGCLKRIPESASVTSATFVSRSRVSLRRRTMQKLSGLLHVRRPSGSDPRRPQYWR